MYTTPAPTGLGIAWSAFIPETVRTGIKTTREFFGIPPITVRSGLTVMGEEKAAEAQVKAEAAERAAGEAAEQIAKDAIERETARAPADMVRAPKVPRDTDELPPTMRVVGVEPGVEPAAPARPAVPGLTKILPLVGIAVLGAALLRRRRRA